MFNESPRDAKLQTITFLQAIRPPLSRFVFNCNIISSLSKARIHLVNVFNYFLIQLNHTITTVSQSNARAFKQLKTFTKRMRALLNDENMYNRTRI